MPPEKIHLTTAVGRDLRLHLRINFCSKTFFIYCLQFSQFSISTQKLCPSYFPKLSNHSIFNVQYFPLFSTVFSPAPPALDSFTPQVALRWSDRHLESVAPGRHAFFSFPLPCDILFSIRRCMHCLVINIPNSDPTNWILTPGERQFGVVISILLNDCPPPLSRTTISSNGVLQHCRLMPSFCTVIPKPKEQQVCQWRRCNSCLMRTQASSRKVWGSPTFFRFN